MRLAEDEENFLIFDGDTMMIGAIVCCLLVLAIYGSICLGYYFFQEKILFVPYFLTPARKKRKRIKSQEFHIDTFDDGHIHALLFHPKISKGLIFYLHGNTGSMRRWQEAAMDLCELNYHVFVLDYRGYGKSRGRRSEALMHQDVITCFDFVQNHLKRPKTIIYGRSLGCAFAVKLASQRTAAGLFLETPFYNLPRLAKYYLPYLPMKLLMRYSFLSNHYIRRINFPVFIVHGTADELVPFQHAHDLYLEAVDAHVQAQFLAIEGGRHSDLINYPEFVAHRAFFLDACYN
jgi:uncharacterized protein